MHSGRLVRGWVTRNPYTPFHPFIRLGVLAFFAVKNRLRCLRTSALLALLLLPSMASAQIPPHEQWLTLDTPHFRVTFGEGLEALARQTATRAEWAHARLREGLVDPPGGKIEILLTDAVDTSNGMASPFPHNRIVLYAPPPTDVAELAFTADWLELLILHELVHTFHLDDAGGLWVMLRKVFGRNMILFPHAQSPGWLVEGLATYYESAFTPGGRVRGTIYDMVLRTAALEDRLFSIDRASGDPRRWPGGATRYIYGSFFLDHIVRQHGEEALPRFIKAYGDQLLRYGLNFAAHRSWGESFNHEWQIWTDSLRRHANSTADSLRQEGLTEPEILTEAGRDAHHPRWSPDGTQIAYSASTGRAQPALRVIRSDGSEGEIAARNQLGTHAWSAAGDLIYSDLEYQGRYRIHSDLWRAGANGARQRLTRGARLAHPDLHPDGETLVAVRSGEGSTELVLGSFAGEAWRPLMPLDDSIHWAYPRWSPSGEEFAAIRWWPGGLVDLVIVDPATGAVTEITRDRALEGGPSWSPDGRYLLFWSDRSGIPNLYAYDWAEGGLYQVTNVVTGAFDPDVSPDGRWIALSYYQTDGYHIARIPFQPESWRPAPETRAEARPLTQRRGHEAWDGPVRPYSAWPSVRPGAWTLIGSAGTELGIGAGAAFFGQDMVARHLWSAEALVHAGAGRLDAAGTYRYQGWGSPTVEIAAAQRWSVACGTDPGSCGVRDGLPSALLRRERVARIGLLWEWPQLRSATWLRPSVDVRERHLEWRRDGGGADEVRFRQTPPEVGVRVEMGRSTARSFALTVGPRTGYSMSFLGEGRRYTRAFEDGAEPTGYLRTVGRGRAYLPVGGMNGTASLALRADLAGETGSRSPGLEVGGAGSGGGSVFPVRGYPAGRQVGTRALAFSVEQRFPLIWVERGIGLLPLYLERVTGQLFADAGTAWCPGDCTLALTGVPDTPTWLASVGAEVGVETKVGFLALLPLRVGVAWPLRGGSGTEVYLRFGGS